MSISFIEFHPGELEWTLSVAMQTSPYFPEHMQDDGRSVD